MKTKSYENKIELAGSVCRIAKNGDLFIAPASRDLIYLLLTAAGLLWIRVWVRDLGIIAAAFLLMSIVVVLMRWVNQPKVQITPVFGMIEWRRWFQRRRCPFGDVSGLNVCLNRRVYAWSAHLVDRRKKVVELNARLELATRKNERLFLGSINGEYAEERALLLAQSIARVIGAPVNSMGNTSKI